MGGLVTCRRRSTFEPLPEPEPVSDNPDSETSSDYHQFDSPLSQAAVEEPEVSASQPDPTVVEGPEVAVSQPDPSTLILAEVRRTVGGFNPDFVRPEISELGIHYSAYLLCLEHSAPGPSYFGIWPPLG